MLDALREQVEGLWREHPHIESGNVTVVRASAGKWKRVAQPFFVDELADGSCLKERRAEQITIAPAVTSPAVNSIFPNLLSDHVTLSHV